MRWPWTCWNHGKPCGATTCDNGIWYWGIVDCPAPEYNNHKKCWSQFRSSPAYKDQDCEAHTINYDRSILHYDGDGNFTHDSWECFHDVYCAKGEWWQRAERKGRIDFDDLARLRRCASDPRKIDVNCDAITEEQLEADAQQYQ